MAGGAAEKAGSILYQPPKNNELQSSHVAVNMQCFDAFFFCCLFFFVFGPSCINLARCITPRPPSFSSTVAVSVMVVMSAASTISTLLTMSFCFKESERIEARACRKKPIARQTALPPSDASQSVSPSGRSCGCRGKSISSR